MVPNFGEMAHLVTYDHHGLLSVSGESGDKDR